MYNSIIQFIEKDTKKIEKLMTEHLLSGNMLRFEEDLMEYQHKKSLAEKRIEKQDEMVREIKEHHKLTGEETVNREIPGLARKSMTWMRELIYGYGA